MELFEAELTKSAETASGKWNSFGSCGRGPRRGFSGRKKPSAAMAGRAFLSEIECAFREAAMGVGGKARAAWWKVWTLAASRDRHGLCFCWGCTVGPRETWGDPRDWWRSGAITHRSGKGLRQTVALSLLDRQFRYLEARKELPGAAGVRTAGCRAHVGAFLPRSTTTPNINCAAFVA